MMAVQSNIPELRSGPTLDESLTPQHRDLFGQAFKSILGTLHAQQDKQQREAMVAAVQIFCKTVVHEFRPDIIDIPTSLSLSTIKPPTFQSINSPQLIHGDNVNMIGGAGLESDEDAIPGKTKKRKRSPSKAKRLVESSQELWPVKVALSSQAGVGELEVARNVFFYELSRLSISVRTDNKVTNSSFDRAEAMAITNFFFAEVMGSSVRQRLASLIAYYQSQEEESMDVGVGSRAEQLSQNDVIPSSIRQFYKSFSEAHRRKVNSQTHYASFMRMVANVGLYHEWVRLRDLAAAKDPLLIRALAQAGLESRRGVDYRSLVNQYLTSELGLESSVALQNTCQAAQGLSGLVKQFGNGVLVLLPSETANRLNRWGNQRMAAVYPILDRCVQAFIPICQLAEVELYNPILQGAKLQTTSFSARNASLEQLLNMSNRVEEILDSSANMKAIGSEGRQEADFEEVLVGEAAPYTSIVHDDHGT